MTQLSDKDHKAQMADMKTFDEQMPCVGVFWYDPDKHVLFRVQKRELTPREIEETAERGIRVINYSGADLMSDSSSTGGFVAWNTNKFEIRVGHWAEPILDELTELVEKEFSLPYFEFVYDEHWDLGHGWSGDMPGSR
jgi:hypothetical protein